MAGTEENQMAVTARAQWAIEKHIEAHIKHHTAQMLGELAHIAQGGDPPDNHLVSTPDNPISQPYHRARAEYHARMARTLVGGK
jgi:hypothetical protein